MIWPVIIAGLSLGLVSSVHCIGMCGPLSLALPVSSLSSSTQKTWVILVYNVGRVITYSIMGLIFGMAGRKIYLAGFQQNFSIALGIIILLLVIQYYVFKKNNQSSLIRHIYHPVQQWILRLWSNPVKINYLIVGMANGLLPCAMVYIAIAGALSTAQVGNAVLFMAMFGTGTLPAMLLFAFFSSFMKISARNTIKKAMPYFFAGMAVLLILRGMNLGIPFISPVMESGPKEAISCH
ncbi:MAG TPA: sulfite exporter TauE/SafE family protein [Chitinophagaceae bacterium]|nr:sulfite exporter TauE/SafE family protein [Chitinophagaceae bacterium]